MIDNCMSVLFIIFNISTGKWWQFNDEDVKPIEEAKVGVIDDSAYDSSTTTSTTETAPTPIDVDATTEAGSSPASPSKKKPKAKAKGTAKAKSKAKGKGKDTEKEKDDEDSEKGNDSQDKGYPSFFALFTSLLTIHYRRISSTMAYMLTYARRVRPILTTTAPDKSIIESICKEMDTLKASAQEYNS
jgi:hypothetical protein